MDYDNIVEWMKTTDNCKRCPLYGSDIVLYEKLYDDKEASCDILFMGINPGKDEAIQKRPFIGRSGKLLRNRIEELGLLYYNIAFSNAILCSTSNEAKIPDIQVCINNCRTYTDIIQEKLHPKLLVAVGKQCANVYFGIQGAMYDINGVRFGNVIPIVHPSFVIRMPTDKNKAMLDYGLTQIKHYLR